MTRYWSEQVREARRTKSRAYAFVEELSSVLADLPAIVVDAMTCQWPHSISVVIHYPTFMALTEDDIRIHICGDRQSVSS